MRFLRPFAEMLAMMLGMCVLGTAFREVHVLVFGGGIAAAWRDHVVLAAFAMAFNMTVPMVLWMRYRGHSWRQRGEMAAGMNVPVLPALVLYGLGVLPAQGVLGMQMLLIAVAACTTMHTRAHCSCGSLVASRSTPHGYAMRFESFAAYLLPARRLDAPAATMSAAKPFHAEPILLG